MDKSLLLQTSLKKIYLIMLVPVLTIVFGIIGLTYIDIIVIQKIYYPGLAFILFMLSIILSFAMPVFINLLLFSEMKNNKNLKYEYFVRNQKLKLIIAMLAPYLIINILFMELPSLYYTVIVMMGIYAAYSYYPSKKRIDTELFIFNRFQKNASQKNKIT